MRWTMFFAAASLMMYVPGVWCCLQRLHPLPVLLAG